MTFAEKLKRLTEHLAVNKSEVSRRAGLQANTISTYMAKPNTIPRADIAARIAKALNVDLMWLIDDTQDWPPVWVNHSEQKLAAGHAA